MTWRCPDIRIATRGMLYSMLGILCLSLTLLACAPKEASAPKGLVETYTRGPLTLTQTTDRCELSTVEFLQLTLCARIPEGGEVQLPDAWPETPELKEGEEEPPWFELLKHEDARPALHDDGTISYTRTYTLAPFLAGTYEIPPLTISFTESHEKNAEEHRFETKSLDIVVTSVLQGDEKPEELLAASEPLSLPRNWTLPLLVLAVLAVVLGVALFFWYRRRKQHTAQPLSTLSPREKALRELAAIRAAQLLEKGEIEPYYVRVCDVLRYYIEDLFHFHAPERTTEEFLEELTQGQILDEKQERLLQTFLQHCDLVKFAKYQPDREEAQNTYQTCRQFIMETSEAFEQENTSEEGGCA